MTASRHLLRIAVLVALGIATGCTSAVSGAARPTTKRPTTPAAARPVRTEQFRTTPSSAGYTAEIWAADTVRNCAGAATGSTRTFLRTHPCSSMQRQLGTTRVAGRPVAFVDERVIMSGYLPAAQFAEVAEGGDITNLLQAGHRLPDGESTVPADATSLVTGQDQTRVAVQSWYLDGGTPTRDKALEALDFTVAI